MSTTFPSENTSNPRRYLTEAQRQAIIAEVAAGHSQVSVAKRFKVHPNTVNVLVRSLRKSGQTAVFGGQSDKSDWKRELYTGLVPYSVEAIKRSINDLNDVHKAAGTAMTHLKAVGVVKDESSQTTNIFVNVQDLPQDWYSRMRPIEESDAPAQDVVVRDITPNPDTDTRGTT